MQDDGCRFIANLTSISKLGAGRVGSVRLMALPDGTSAALKQDFPGKNQQADFHREVRTQTRAGALAPLVLATCGPRYEILSELLPAPWIEDLSPCRSSPHATSRLPFCADFEALLAAMDAIGLQQDDFIGQALVPLSDISLDGTKFADLGTEPFAAWDAVPVYGKVQILLVMGMMEWASETDKPHYMNGGTPGKITVFGIGMAPQRALHCNTEGLLAA